VKINVYFKQHFEIDSGVNEYRFERHRGTPAIDSSSPWFAQSVQDDMLDNCSTIADFRDQMPTAVKNWWDALPVGERSQRYDAFKAMAGK